MRSLGRAAAARTPASMVLVELAFLGLGRPPAVDGVAGALRRFDASGAVDTAGAAWWSNFDSLARRAHERLRVSSWSASAKARTWRRMLPFGAASAPSVELSPFWEWALAVCAADGRLREAALAAERLPRGQRGLLPLLVLRCTDWVPAVREAALAALGVVVTEAEPAELAWAVVCAWNCEARQRGAEAVRIVTDRLTHVPASVWRSLLLDPDIRIRRRALAEPAALGHDHPDVLLDLALSHRDVLVSQRAAERLLQRVVPPGVDAPAGAEAEALLGRLLTATHPAVRATAVTVLRRAQRVELAEPFIADPSAAVREVARWVLRSSGVDPAVVCRARAAQAVSPSQASAGLVRGLAECGDRADAPWLRGRIRHPHAKVRGAALQAVGRLRPPEVSTEELCALLDRETSPSVLRIAAELLAPAAASLPRPRVDAWLAPDRSPRLRRHAARLLRGRGPWERLEADLRLLHDPDVDIARDAREDAHAVAGNAGSAYSPPTAAQHEALTTLLDAAAGADGADGADVALDARCVDLIRFMLAHARPH